jgi:hypothetical protein
MGARDGHNSAAVRRTAKHQEGGNRRETEADSGAFAEEDENGAGKRGREGCREKTTICALDSLRSNRDMSRKRHQVFHRVHGRFKRRVNSTVLVGVRRGSTLRFAIRRVSEVTRPS